MSFVPEKPSLRVTKDHAVGVVVDVQDRLFPHIHECELLAAHTEKLVRGMNILNLPVFVTEQYVKGLGRTIQPLQNALGDLYAPMEKMAFSCCGSQEFSEVIENLGRRFVILAGIEAHICVLQTALDLRQLGYTPVVVEDCVSSRKPNDKAVALKRMRKAGCIITTVESLLFELTVVAGTDTFKQISALVK
jgi:nicotinamidase-related amidase